jgi:hypothetical protein
MQNQRNARRPHGTGSLFEKNGKFYGQWRINGQLVKRSIGPIRTTGTREGLTKSQAEARLRAMMGEVAPPVAERLSVDVAGRRLIAHLTTMGRKPSTLEGYESFLRVHLVPFFGDARCRRSARTTSRASWRSV